MNEVMPRRERLTWSPEERTEWLWLFEQSGQSAADFCRDNELPAATFSQWRRHETEKADGPSGGLINVTAALAQLTPSEPSAPTEATTSMRAVVQLPSGWRIEVPLGTDARWIGELLQALVTVKG